MLLSFIYLVLRAFLQRLPISCRDSRDLEIVVLRHQLRVMRRQVARPDSRNRDRAFLAAASRLLVELSPRELDVLSEMAEGKTNAAIARSLVLTQSTVEKHVTSIFSKLGLSEELDVHHRVGAVLAFLREAGLIRPGS
jgi:DNA-binding NarL/FixJ family response regulator